MQSSRLQSFDFEALCVPIQWGGADVPPVFCVPGAGASVTSFVQLAAALGSATPVYGLQPRGLDGMDKPFCDVQEAAQTYLPLLKRAARNGPCRLVGHSFGGWIAFEMAKRLERTRDSAVTLTLVDAQAPSDKGVFRLESRGADALADLVKIIEQGCDRSLRVSRQDFARLPETDRVPLLARAMAAQGLISSRTDIAAVEAMVRVFEANVNTGYLPESPLRGPATLVRASESPSRTPNEDRVDPVVAWRQWLPQLTDSRVPGNHMTMLSKPHVAALAAIVQGQANRGPQIV